VTERDNNNDSDDDLFREAMGEMGDVAPLKSRTVQTEERVLSGSDVGPTAAQLERQKNAVVDRDEEGEERIMTLGEVPQVAPDAVLSWRQDGVQLGVFDKLKRGDYPVEAALDLHHKTVKEARLLVWRFLTDAQSAGYRCVVIAHGRGERSPQPARLKGFALHWLTNLPLAIAFHSAPAKLGGLGATLVLVQKSHKAKALNRERHGGRAEDEQAHHPD